MKGIICYYSGSGNTKLACEYLAKRTKNVEFDLHDMVTGGAPDLGEYGLTGFACFADFGGPSYLVQQFVEKLPAQKGKPAFILNTYGFMSGKTQKALAKWVTARGFLVVAAHSLHTPENYPPMVTKGRGAEDAPSADELADFDSFISRIDSLAVKMEKGEALKKGKLKGFPLMFGRDKARKDMGEKFVDEALCNECGTCERSCPYGAIGLSPKPAFDMSKCYGCWSCYNHCPKKAIYTKKFRGEGHYPGPLPQLREKLKSPAR